MCFKKIIFALIPIFLVLLYYKNVILHINSHMTGWYDGPFIIWIFQNNIKHFASFDLRNIFETNAMYPFTNTLSFTEHMFFPSLIALVISTINRNPVFQFNVVMILNHILVYISFFMLSTRFTKSLLTQVISSFFAAFSPYLIGQSGHLQMMFIWPFFLSVFFILHPKRKSVHLILAGLLLAIQFHSAVYLGLMGLFIILTREIISIIDDKKIMTRLKEMILFLTTFFLISLPSIYGYLQVQKQYKPVRGQEEFVNYSAHITDYVLFAPNNSFINNVFFQNLLGKFNQHIRGEMAAFVGFTPILLIAFWLLNSNKSRLQDENERKRRITIKWTIVLIILGVLFSIGPRANFNGQYLVFPLPYYFLLKFLPVLGIMRALARWYFIVIFAIHILAIFSLDYILSVIPQKKLKYAAASCIFLLFILEFLPAPQLVNTKNWNSDAYRYLQKKCKIDNGPILEYPFEYREKAKDIGKYLSLKTNTLMSSTLHSCPTLSGFSSFEPPLFKKWQEDFDTNGITDQNIAILKNLRFKYVKLNYSGLRNEEKDKVELVIKSKSLSKMYADFESVIYEIKY